RCAICGAEGAFVLKAQDTGEICMETSTKTEMTDIAAIVDRVEAWHARMRTLARDPARPPEILAVTKTIPLEWIAALPPALICGLGENRVQEILEKFQNYTPLSPIHLIGRLQTNKVKYIIDKVCMIQSLDRADLAQEIDRRAQRAGLRMPVLLQVNVGREPQKGGMPPEEVIPFSHRYAALPGIRIAGLMTVMPVSQEPVQLRPLFIQMRELFCKLQQEAIAGVDMRHLSMGMSGDAEIAAQEGATMVRLGSALFGPRA
ncbi:MAG: YggS family pyridoxal phosphate-dependent enzyme, partial [Clostridia bacterium]